MVTPRRCRGVGRVPRIMGTVPVDRLEALLRMRAVQNCSKINRYVTLCVGGCNDLLHFHS